MKTLNSKTIRVFVVFGFILTQLTGGALVPQALATGEINPVAGEAVATTNPDGTTDTASTGTTGDGSDGIFGEADSVDTNIDEAMVPTDSTLSVPTEDVITLDPIDDSQDDSIDEVSLDEQELIDQDFLNRLTLSNKPGDSPTLRFTVRNHR